MADPRNKPLMPLGLGGFGNLQTAMDNEPPIPSAGQIAWFGTQMVPGSSGPDVAGKMPGPPSYDQPVSEFMSGEPMPSYAENIKRGGFGGYFDATMQGLGVAGDAITYSAPIFGPFSPLPASIGRGVKGLGVAGQMLKASTNIPKVDSTIVHTGDRKVKKISDEEDIATASSETNSRDIETVSERGIISLLNDQDYLKKKGIRYDDPNKKYDVLDIINRAIDRIPKNNSGQRNHLQRQFDEYLSDEFVNGPPRTFDEIMQELDKNKPTIRENIHIREFEKPYEGMGVTSRAEASPKIPAELEEYTTVSDVYAQIQPRSYGTTSFSIHGGKYGNETLFTGDHPRFGGYDPKGWSIIPGDTGDNNRNRVFHNRFAVYDMPDGKVDYVAVESQSDPYQLTTKSDMYRPRRGNPSVQARLQQEGGVDVTYQDQITGEEIPMGMHPLNSARIDEDWAPDEGGLYIRGTPTIGEGKHPYEGGYFGIRANGFKNSFPFDGSANEHGYEHPMQKVISDYFDHIMIHHVPHENFDEVYEVQGNIQEAWVDLVDEWRDGLFSDGLSTDELSFEEAGLPNFLDYAAEQLKPLMSKIKIAEAPTPMIDDWYHISTKSHIQNAIAEEADRIKFPINARALNDQMMGEILLPPQLKEMAGYEGVGEAIKDNALIKNSRAFPSDEAVDLAKKHKKFNRQALNTIEQEYGINLNRKVVKDRFGQEFVEIELTPEIKEAMQTLLLSRGGLVRQPLMNLKYDR